MYLLTKATALFGRKIYYVVGECENKYLVSPNLQGYYACTESWFYLNEDDVEMVDTNLSLLENKLLTTEEH